MRSAEPDSITCAPQLALPGRVPVSAALCPALHCLQPTRAKSNVGKRCNLLSWLNFDQIQLLQGALHYLLNHVPAQLRQNAHLYNAVLADSLAAGRAEVTEDVFTAMSEAAVPWDSATWVLALRAKVCMIPQRRALLKLSFSCSWHLMRRKVSRHFPRCQSRL